MSIVISTLSILWGVNENKPVLPIGYRYIEGQGKWLMAEWRRKRVGRSLHEVILFYVSSEGNGALYRQGFKQDGLCSECGKSKSRWYIDTNVMIQLPQKQLCNNKINS